MVDVLGGMETTVKRNILKYAAGRTMFCPGCQTIMDCKRTVTWDLLKEDKLLMSKVLCTACYDSKIAGNAAIAEAVTSKGLTVEVTDGRVLWPSRKK